MKAYKTTPKNEHFFSEYASLIPTLVRIGFIAQVVSYLTEIGGIQAVLFSTLKDFNPVLAGSVSWAGAFLGAALLEVGLRKFVPYSTKAIIHKRFSGEHLAMSIFILLCASLLIMASGILSFNNSKNMVEVYMPQAETKDHGEAQNIYQQSRVQAYQDFKADSTEIADRYQMQIKAIQSSYQSKIETKNKEIEKWSDRERVGKKFTTIKNNLRINIGELESQRDQKIVELQSKRADELQKIAQTKTALIYAANNDFNNLKDSIDTFNAMAIGSTNRKVKSYGGGLAYFTVFCLIVFILSVILNEIHKKGSGIETKIEHGAFDFAPGVMSEFWAGLQESLEYNTRKKIDQWFSPNSKRDEIIPGYGRTVYDYSNLKQRKILIADNLADNPEKMLTTGGKITQTHYRKSPPDKVLTTELSGADKPELTTTDNGAADNVRPLSDKSRQQIGGELSAIEIEASDNGEIVKLSGPIFSTVRRREFNLSDIKEFEDFKASARQSYHRQFVSGESDTRLTHKARWNEMEKVLDYYGIEYWKKGENKITYDYKQSDEFLKNNP